MMPRWPVYIPSKGRADTALTMRMFNEIGVPYTVFVEPQEAEAYARAYGEDRLHVLPHRGKGLTVTRNYIWDYAERQGHARYWTFDDNIEGLYRLNRNLKTPCADATIMAVIEDFAERYENLPIAGMHYFMFAPRKVARPPYTLNTRVYSNMLIQTDARDREGRPFRNVTFYNDDTDLCLRVLKAGLCTVLFSAFLIRKAVTMTMAGGMTDYYEQTNKRREFAEELKAAHPDCVAVVWRWGRWHHSVDYSAFRQQLRRRPGVVVAPGVNNYGMVLEERQPSGAWVAEGAPAIEAAPEPEWS